MKEYRIFSEISQQYLMKNKVIVTNLPSETMRKWNNVQQKRFSCWM